MPDNRLRAELYRDQGAVLLEDVRVCATLNQMAIGNSDAYLSGLITTFGTSGTFGTKPVKVRMGVTVGACIRVTLIIK